MSRRDPKRHAARHVNIEKARDFAMREYITDDRILRCLETGQAINLALWNGCVFPLHVSQPANFSFGFWAIGRVPINARPSYRMSLVHRV